MWLLGLYVSTPCHRELDSLLMSASCKELSFRVWGGYVDPNPVLCLMAWDGIWLLRTQLFNQFCHRVATKTYSESWVKAHLLWSSHLFIPLSYAIWHLIMIHIVTELQFAAPPDHVSPPPFSADVCRATLVLSLIQLSGKKVDVQIDF